MQKGIIKNYFYTLSYQLLAILAPFITTPYVSRVLGAGGVGTYSYVTSIVTYFTMFSTLGMNTLGQLKIAETRDDRYSMSKVFRDILRTRIFTTAVSTVVFFVLVCCVQDERSVFIVSYFAILACVLDISWMLQGLEEFKKTVLRNYLVKIVSIVAIFAFVNSPNDVVIYTGIMQGSICLGNITLWIYLKQYLVPVHNHKTPIISILKESIVYFIPAFATSIYTVLDKTMLGLLAKSAVENGYYEQAYKIERIAVTLVTSLGTVMMPRIAYLYKSKNHDAIGEALAGSTKFTMFVAIPITVGIGCISDLFVPWFFGPGYDACKDLMKIFSFLVLFIALDNLIGQQYLIPHHKQKEYNTGVIIGAVVNCSLNVFLIPALQSMGAAIASVIAEALILAWFIRAGKPYFTIKKMLFDSYKYFIAAVVMGGYICMISKLLHSAFLDIALVVCSGFGIYILCLLFLQEKTVLHFVSVIKKIIQK